MPALWQVLMSRISALRLRCESWLYVGDDSLLLWLKRRSLSVSERCKGEYSWRK
jgi:hypothetical protein